MKKILFLSMMVCVLGLTQSVTHAQITMINFTPNTGTWDYLATNFAGGSAPTSTQGASFTANSGATLQVNTPISAPNIARFAVTVNTGGSFIFNMLGNFTSSNTTSGTPSSTFTNTTGVASNLIIDLNGFTFDATDGRSALTLPATAGDSATTVFQLQSSTGTGIYKAGTFGTSGSRIPSLAVKNNVILQFVISGGPNGINTSTSTFTSGSTAQFVTGGASTVIVGSSPTAKTVFGSLIIGNSSGSADIPTFTLSGDTGGTYVARVATVAKDFTIKSGANMIIGTGGSSTQGFYGFKVAGNYTDENTTAGTYNNTVIGAFPYNTNGLISFNGGNGSGSEKTVTINRQLLAAATSGYVTSFTVGDGTTAGNVKLGHDLNTAGTLMVYGNSRLNMANYTLTTGADIAADARISLPALKSVSILSGATIADTFGVSTHGLISAGGTLTMNSFNLELNFDGTSWTNGSSLQIFHFSTVSGTLSITNNSWVNGIYTTSWTGFTQSGNDLILTGVSVVAVPEPGAALLIGAFGGLLVWTVRRKTRRA